MARPGAPRGQDSLGVRVAGSLFRSEKGAMKWLGRYGLFVASLLVVLLSVSYTHLTLPTKLEWCRSRWSPYH